jgi:hypothetical protein
MPPVAGLRERGRDDGGKSFLNLIASVYREYKAIGPTDSPKL